MKKIGVLIDFTEGSRIAFSQALALAVKANAKLCAITIAFSNDKKGEAQNQLKSFVLENSNGNEVETCVAVGNIFDAAAATAAKEELDLMVIVTHGVIGMFQHLFGANILKLVQTLNCPSIVVHSNIKTSIADINSILFPVGPSPQYDIKINQTAAFAKLLNAGVVIYVVERQEVEDNLKTKNIANAKAYFEKNGVKCIKITEDLQHFSAGYSRQSLQYAKANDISIISIMAKISINDSFYGNTDKENFLINESGIPILCCNALV